MRSVHRPVRRLTRPVRFSTLPHHVPVVVCGAGPVGLTLSLALANFGVRHLVVDRAAGPTVHPQAHYINARGMEIMRNVAPGLDEAVEALTVPIETWRRYVYCVSVTGQRIGAVDHFGPGMAHLRSMQRSSPCRVAHLPQSRLVPMLVERMAQTETSLLWNHQVKHFQQEDECVNVFIKGPSGGETVVSCQYLVGADGASSAVRARLGIPMEGPVGLQHLMNVHFTYPDLKRVAAAHPAMLYFVYNPSVVGVIVAHDWEAGECVMQIPYFPPQQSEKDFPDEVCTAIVRSALGPGATGPLVVHKVNPWTMSAVNAGAYQRGRALLVGDACHQMPPAGGFGMNSGMADAHNLAWKLASVLRGLCRPELLTSYFTERHAAIARNIALSQRNFRRVLEVTRVLGLDPNHLKTLQGVVGALPAALAAPLFDASLWLARKQLDFVSEANPVWAARLRQVQHMFESGESLALLYPKQDLGVSYAAGCLVASDGEAKESDSAVERQEYRPSIDPGQRFPHFWVEAEGQPRRSVLDLFGGRSLEWALVVNGERPGSLQWLAAMTHVNRLLPQPALRCVLVNGAATTVPDADPAGHVAAVRAAEDPATGGHWPEVRDALGDDAVLVRPDGHVAWRATAGPGEWQPLANALQQLGFVISAQ